MSEKKPLKLEVTEKNKKERIDLYLSKKIPELTRSLLKEAIKEGKILLNGKPSSPKNHVVEGDQITFLEVLKAKKNIELKESSLALEILYEDSELIVVNKQASTPTHPSLSNHGTGNSLVEAIITHCKKEKLWEKEKLSSERPGVVHRLDKDTTGALVWAKTKNALEHLQKQFKEKSNKREYLVLLEGEMTEKEKICESFLIRDPHNKTRFISTKEENSRGKWAKSYFKKEAVYQGKYTLCRVTLHTGRTHQIRVHAKELGLPVLGDPVYNIKKTVSLVFEEKTRKLIENLSRQMLHAKTLGFTHPVTEKFLSFEAPLPKDFADLLEVLEG